VRDTAQGRSNGGSGRPELLPHPVPYTDVRLQHDTLIMDIDNIVSSIQGRLSASPYEQRAGAVVNFAESSFLVPWFVVALAP